ncbi:MAG: phosphate ABC transporter permease PstA [Gammaproteobacteria bacterium]|nr:MAG: phosphate ABC transporter permease PstA [Gammaproteobacteria bacterium]
MKHRTQSWITQGSPWVWLTAGMVSVSLVMVLGLLGLIGARGLGHFWPKPVLEADYLEPGGGHSHIIGQVVDEEEISAQALLDLGQKPPRQEGVVRRLLVKSGNRRVAPPDFRWVYADGLTGVQHAPELMVVERHQWGDFIGRLTGLKEHGEPVATPDLWAEYQRRIARAEALYRRIRAIEKDEIGAINYRIERLRLERRRLELDGVRDPDAFADIEERKQAAQREYQALSRELADLRREAGRDTYTARIADGREVEQPVAEVVRAYRPNAMGLTDKLTFYLAKLHEFVFDEPREANTEGGVFPALFGTVLMVMLMSLIVTPFGVVAAVYLREYATQNWFTRAVRIAVNNLAGVPSIVFGVFGLGFFVYTVGERVDHAFFPEALPAPTFGTPGLLWASLTLALLTVPVVIVATEEGLTRIPNAFREGSLALGATKAETLWRIILPMSTPAIMTGMILAIARAAGEVAPLMLVGVVKLAPSLPLDGNFPYLHLERKFMHLGFHIYDVGFQSPNVEAARPLVYATSLLLVLIVVALNLAAIRIRNRLEDKYHAAEH